MFAISVIDKHAVEHAQEFITSRAVHRTTLGYTLRAAQDLFHDYVKRVPTSAISSVASLLDIFGLCLGASFLQQAQILKRIQQAVNVIDTEPGYQTMLHEP